MKTKPAETITAASADKVSMLRSALRSAPPKKGVHSRSPLKAAVAQLLPDLLAFRAKGYNGKELAEIMRNNGLVIAVATLNKYINEARFNPGGRSRRNVQRISAKPKTAARRTPSREADVSGAMASPSLLATKPLVENRSVAKDVLGHQFDYDV